MDETGVMLSMLSSVKVLVSKNDLRDYRGAGVKRTMVTAIECVSADGRALLPMIIWPASSHRSNWTTYPTPGWYYAFSENGYTDSKISLEWLKCVFDPQTKAQAQQKPRILIRDKVLGNIQKPHVEPGIEKVHEVNVGTCLQGEVPLTPATPVTPVTTEAVTSLKSLIERHARANDETSRHRLQRCLQKLTNATEMSFAERDLLADENKLLFKQNNEAKARRSTKSTVVGKAKVMRYEDIEMARAKRAEKEEAKAKGKGKPGRKRKSAGQEADTQEPEADTLLGLGIGLVADTPQPKAKRKRGPKSKNAVTEVVPPEANIPEARDNVAHISEALNTPYAPVMWTSEAHIASVLWTSEVQVAPVARMY